MGRATTWIAGAAVALGVVASSKALGAKALHLVAPNLGHGVMNQPCLRESLQRFFNAETDAQALDPEHLKAQCLAKIPRALPFQPVQNITTGSQP